MSRGDGVAGFRSILSDLLQSCLRVEMILKYCLLSAHIQLLYSSYIYDQPGLGLGRCRSPVGVDSGHVRLDQILCVIVILLIASLAG